MRILLEAEISHEIERRIIEKAYYLSPSITEITFVRDSAGTQLVAQLRGDADLAHIEIRLVEAIKQVSDSYRFVQNIVYFERTSARNGGSARAIMDTLIREGHVVRLMEGGFAYRGLFLKLMRVLDKEILAMAKELGAEEEEYPALTPAGPLVKSGYVASFPNQILLAHHLREDVDVLEKFASQHAKTGDSHEAIEVEHSALSPSTQLLAPAVCYNCFAAQSDQAIPAEGRVVTALGSCHRYEYRNFNGLERLQNFKMREIIFMGTSEFVTNCRESLLEMAKSIVDRFDLPCSIVNASDPFFTDISLGKRTFQDMQRLKYEMTVPLNGTDGDGLAVASFNLHQTNMSESYNIQLDSGNVMYSGCVGYGFERFCFAFLATHGVDPDQWPDYVRDAFRNVS